MSTVTDGRPSEAVEHRGGAPTRGYKILERVELDGPEEAYGFVPVFEKGGLEQGTVEARNGTNAMRKAFKIMREARGATFEEAVLLVLPINQWKPTPVHTKRTESITVAVGA